MDFESTRTFRIFGQGITKSGEIVTAWARLDFAVFPIFSAGSQSGGLFMHFDLAHAAVSAVVIGILVFLLRDKGEAGAGKSKWNWRIFFAVFVAMFLINLVWPYDTP
ncbi:hypothetical protein [Qipengyuania aquimaris]|uniref:hypothetical protein n=1 Tax=Qipengyuania aquimaris TaxID=255984 RepID=UPI001FD02D0D|nr:hypothetical protein [Qipengyuania aquimaris]UOR15611.1 hypothetical protein LCM05_00805 [Qipengyuania aquimaris]